MKHVFLINSHTTFLTAMGIIEYLKLSNDDIVFLYLRHYKNSVFELTFKIIDISDIDDYNKDDAAGLKKIIKYIDGLVKEYVYDEFILYTPHMQMKGAQALYTNKSCIEVCYVQEGALPQPKAFVTNLKFMQKLKMLAATLIKYRTFRVWRAFGWYQPGVLKKQSMIKCFAVNDKYFKYMPSELHLIKWPIPQMKSEVQDGNVVFVFDGFISNGLAEKDVYYRLCQEIISLNISNINYLKFHPAQTSDERDFIINLFKKANREFIVCNDTIPFELTLCVSKNLKVVGFSSSLLLFAHYSGHEMEPYDNLLVAESRIYSKHILNSGYPILHNLKINGQI